MMTLLVFGYGFLLYLYDVRFKYVNQISYNSWIFISVKMMTMLMGIIIATGLYQFFVLLNAAIFTDTSVGLWLLVISVFFITVVVFGVQRWVRETMLLGIVIFGLYAGLRLLLSY